MKLLTSEGSRRKLAWAGGLFLLSGCISDEAPRAEVEQPDPEPAHLTSLVAGAQHMCALLQDGRVACWGRNATGQLGTGDTRDRSVPTLVEGLTGAVELAAGSSHTCARLDDGRVACWGSNDALGHGGSLGRGSTPRPVTVAASGGPRVADHKMRPWCPTHGELEGIVGIDAHGSRTCAVHRSGAVLCWGDNREHDLGVAPTAHEVLCPMPVEGVAGAVAVEVEEQACATLTEGAVCWGPPNRVGGVPRTRSAGFRVGVRALEPGSPFGALAWPAEATRPTPGPLVNRFTDLERHDALESLAGLPEEVVELAVSWPTELGEPQAMASVRFASSTWPVRPCGLTDDGRMYCAPALTDEPSEPVAWEAFEVRVRPTPVPSEHEDPPSGHEEPPSDCPAELVWGDPSWPNRVVLEYRGLRRTIHFEHVVGEFVPAADRVLVHLPDLAIHTSAGGRARTDGWSGAIVTAPVVEGPSEAYLSVTWSSDTLGCFQVPPRTHGSLTLLAASPPPRGGMGGHVEGTFELIAGSAELGRVEGSFRTERVTRRGLRPVSPSHNQGRLRYDSGLAYHRPNGSLLLDLGTGEGHRWGSGVRGSAVPGVYHDGFGRREINRVHIETFGPDRVKGWVDTVDVLELLLRDQIRDLDPGPSPLHFDLPLLTVPRPGLLEWEDPSAPVRNAVPEITPERAALSGPVEQRFTSYYGWEKVHRHHGRGERLNNRYAGIRYVLRTRLEPVDPQTTRFRYELRGPSAMHQVPEQTIELDLHAESFAPKERRQAFQHEHAPGREARLVVGFDDEGMELRAEGPWQPEATARRRRADTLYDPVQLLHLLPLLSHEPGLRYRFHLLDVPAPNTTTFDQQTYFGFDVVERPVALALRGRESLLLAEETPVLAVELRFLDDTSNGAPDLWTYYLAADAPHALLAIDQGWRGVILQDLGP